MMVMSEVLNWKWLRNVESKRLFISPLQKMVLFEILENDEGKDAKSDKMKEVSETASVGDHKKS